MGRCTRRTLDTKATGLLQRIKASSIMVTSRICCSADGAPTEVSAETITKTNGRESIRFHAAMTIKRLC